MSHRLPPRSPNIHTEPSTGLEMPNLFHHPTRWTLSPTRQTGLLRYGARRCAHARPFAQLGCASIGSLSSSIDLKFAEVGLCADALMGILDLQIVVRVVLFRLSFWQGFTTINRWAALNTALLFVFGEHFLKQSEDIASIPSRPVVRQS